MRASRRDILDTLRPSLPWLMLGAALALATMPAARALLFGVTLTLDDLGRLRCLSW